jgi:hypothetical protein
MSRLVVSRSVVSRLVVSRLVVSRLVMSRLVVGSLGSVVRWLYSKEGSHGACVEAMTAVSAAVGV